MKLSQRSTELDSYPDFAFFPVLECNRLPEAIERYSGCW